MKMVMVVVIIVLRKRTVGFWTLGAGFGRENLDFIFFFFCIYMGVWRVVRGVGGDEVCVL